MIGGTEMWYYMPGLAWCFSYIHTPFMQKGFFWSIIVGYFTAVFFLLVLNLNFLIGGIIDYYDCIGDWGHVYYPIIYDAVFVLLNAIVYYFLFPQMTAYYRWREQDWWNKKWD